MTTKNRPTSISKLLSKNDVGETGSHQVGILIPKNVEILSFFPPLAPNVKNPRALIRFREESGSTWDLAFIYYNNKFFGGTRDEYRLTRMTAFVRAHALRVNDELILTRDDETGIFRISFDRKNKTQQPAGGILKLGSEWRVIPIA
jgi:hypothetical protein